MSTKTLAELESQFGITKQSSGENTGLIMSREELHPAAATKQSMGQSLVHSAGAIGGAIAGIAANSYKSGVNLVQGTARNMGLDQRYNALESQRKALEAKDMAIHQQYKSGKLKTEDFHAAQKGLKDEYLKLSEQSKSIQSDHYGYGAVAKDYAQVAGTALSIAAPFAAPEIAGAEAGAVGAGKIASASKGVMGAIRTGTGAGTAENLSLKGVPMFALKSAGRNVAMINPTIQTATAVPEDLVHGNYGGAAANAAFLIAPAVVSKVAKVLPGLSNSVTAAMYGQDGFFSAIARAGGPDLIAHLDSLGGSSAKALEGTLRKVQQYNLDQVGGDVKQAAAHFVAWLENSGRDISKISPEQMSQELKTWVSANEKVTRLHAQGKLFTGADGKPVVLKDGQRVIAGRYNQDDHKALVGLLDEQTDVAGRRAIVASQEKAGADWTKNPNVLAHVKTAIEAEDWKTAIGDIQRMRSLFASGKNVKLAGGYFPTISKSARAEFKTVAKTAELDRGKDAKPVLGKIGALLTKSGVGTQSNNAVAYRKFQAALETELQDAGVSMGRQEVSRKIEAYALEHPGIVDERQLSVGSLKDALNISHDEAKAIQKAFTSAYSKSSLEDLSVAGKIQNAMYKVPGYRTYSRIQGLARYEFNPFFRAQEAVETSVLSSLMSHGKANSFPGPEMIDRMFKGSSKSNEIDSTVKTMKEAGLLRNGGFGQEGANNATFSGISARISKGQQRALAGFVQAMAKKQGSTVEEFLRTADQATIDNVRKIVQYPKEGFTSSNFAKTLNLLVFPARYNIKLAGMLGKAFADAPAFLQIATLKGAHDLSNWLSSDEGIKWQSENSEALSIIKYLSPLNNLAGVFKLLGGKHVTLGDFGTIGGLPLGFVSQLIQHETGLNTDTPYLNPKTGEVQPEKIPESMKGHVQLALTDLINSMYSFPGRTFGFSISKTQLTQKIPGLAPGSGDFKDSTRTDTTDEQKNIQRVLQTGSSTKKVKPMAIPAIKEIPKFTTVPRLSELTAKQKKAAAPKVAKPKIYARRSSIQ